MTRAILFLLLALSEPAGGGRVEGLAPQEARVPWTASRLTGTPEPPPPFRLERAWPALAFDKPVELVRSPDLKRLFVVQQYGRILSFPEEGEAAKAELFFDLKAEIRGWERVADAKGVDQSYAIAFHPRFAENRFCYVMYTLGHKTKGKALPEGSRVSRFKVTETDPPRADPASETILLEWLEGGHNGCCLRFGPDGMLYVSTGDATPPSPPDALDAGQDVTNLLSAILRIDVDRAEAGRNYAVPPDNPFVNLAGARPEIWAYGFRNPWRMSFDAAGNLWVGDVGWELWELLFRIERGGNYGWSIMEGPQPVRPNARRGPTPILPPAMAIPHSEAASITGGFVYRGKRFPELAGRYVFADYELFRVFDARVDGKELADRRDLARTEGRVVAMAEDREGELLFLDHVGGGIHRLVPDDRIRHNPDFPTRLSRTGLAAPGVYPYAVRAEPWADGATAERAVAVPGDATLRLEGSKPVFPKDSALAKTLSLDGRKVETQVLHFDGKDWQAYTYAWSEDQSDATLVGPRGEERTVGGRRWTFHARATCMGCHGVSWVRHLQGFNEAQLGEGAKRLRELRILPEKGFLGGGPDDPKALVDPRDEKAPLEARARAYLHANCAVCHRPGGGGTSTMDLRAHKPVQDLKALNVRPSFGDFGIKDAYLLAGGDPARSTVYYRMAKTGHGRMPYIGSSVVDREGLELVARWIETLPPAPGAKAGEAGLETTSGALNLVRAIDAGRAFPEPELLDRALRAPETVRGLLERFVPPEKRPKRLGPKADPAEILALHGDPARGERLFFESASLQCRNCHMVGGRGESYGPELSKIGAKYPRAALLETILEPSKQVDPKFATWAVQTEDGAVHTGLLLEKTDQAVVIKDAARKEVRLRPSSVARMAAQKTSAMPEFLVQDLSAAEAADLLDFLASLK